jgi:hypothetical protein
MELIGVEILLDASPEIDLPLLFDLARFSSIIRLYSRALANTADPRVLLDETDLESVEVSAGACD